MKGRGWAVFLAATAGAMLLVGCGDQKAGDETPQASAATAPERADRGAAERRDYASSDRRDNDRPDPRDEPTPMHDGGRPLWSATSRYSSEDNAARAFRSHGEEFGAETVDAYVDAAHAFLKNPPEDVLTLTRANGDMLYYAPGDNIFAVAREDGAPRTLFKPEEGMAYWREQETREQARAERAERGGSRRESRSAE